MRDLRHGAATLLAARVLRAVWEFLRPGTEEPVASGSRFWRACSTDGIGGRIWSVYLLMSHGLVWAGVLGGLDAESVVDRIVLPVSALAGIWLSVLWWRAWLRNWRRVG